MAEQVLTNAFIMVSTADLSDHLVSIEGVDMVELQDITAMGSSARKRIPGLADGSLTATYNQDYAAGSVDDTHWQNRRSTGFSISFRPANTARSATNPEYAATFVMGEIPLISGTVGDAHQVSFTYQAITEYTKDVSST